MLERTAARLHIQIMDAQIMLRFAALLVALISGCVCQNIVIDPRSPVQIGDTLSITCTGEINVISRMTMELWKTQDTDTGERIQLSDNGNVLLDSSRFSASIQEDPNSDSKLVDMVFVITDVQPYDSGTYICQQIEKGSPTLVDADVIVMDEPDTMTLTVDTLVLDHTSTHNEPIEVDAGVFKPIECVVEGGNPAPDVKIFMDGQDITNKEFVAESKMLYVMDEDQDFHTPKAHVTLKTKNSEGLKLTSPHRHSQLSCVATMHGSSQPSLMRNASFNFKAVAPVFVGDCPRQVLVGIYRAAEVKVEVRSTPAPSLSYVEWEPEEFNMTKKRLNITQKMEGHATLSLVPVSDNIYSINMKFDKVYDQAFAKYSFVAENAVGESTCQVDLAQDPALPVVDDSGSAGVLCSILTVAVSLMLSTIFYS